jgi:hypothetical protein
MPIIARAKTADYRVAPEGLHPAVCCDVVDLGDIETEWGTKPKVLIIWQIEEHDKETGTPFTVSQRYTLSLHEKSNLRKMLESWRGKKFEAKDLEEDYDLEKLIGINCQVQVVNNISSKGGVFANVQAVVKPEKNQHLMVWKDYVRVCNRAANGDNGNYQATDQPPF